MLKKSGFIERSICNCGQSNKKIGFDGYNSINMPGTACEDRVCNTFIHQGVEKYLVLTELVRKFYFLFPCGKYYEIDLAPADLLAFIKENYGESM
jgi:hypothetical protein